jgi:hypothetical protein
MPLRAAIDCAEGRLAGDELVDVALQVPGVLSHPAWRKERECETPGSASHRDEEPAPLTSRNSTDSASIYLMIGETTDVPSRLKYLRHRSSARCPCPMINETGHPEMLPGRSWFAECPVSMNFPLCQ